MRKALASLFASALIFAGVAGPAAAQPPVQAGLINLFLTVETGDILSDNEVVVQVPVSAAANICGVQVGVIAALGQDVECVARSGHAEAHN